MEKDFKKPLVNKYKQVNRLIKEYNSYNKEVEKLQQKRDLEVESQVDDYVTKKTNEYLQESEQTRDEVKKKVRTFLDELIALVSEITSEEAKESEEYKEACKIMDAGLELFK